MAVIYLRHPVHGKKVATMEAEAVYDESNGWERFDPDAPAAPPANALAAAREVVAEVVDPPENSQPEIIPVKLHPLDHDGDGKPGGSLPGPRRRRTPAAN